MNWKCLLIVLLVTAALGTVIWFLVRDKGSLEAQNAQLLEKVKQAEQKADESDKLAEEQVVRADSIQAARVELEQQMAKLKAAYASATKPKTVQEYEVYTHKLTGHIGLLEKDLELSDLQVLHLKKALGFKSDQVRYLQAAIDYEHKRADVAIKQAKKERRRKIVVGIAAALAGGLAGYGMGQLR